MEKLNLVSFRERWPFHSYHSDYTFDGSIKYDICYLNLHLNGEIYYYNHQRLRSYGEI